MANSADPDQTGPSVWVYTTLFAQTCLFKYMSLKYIYMTVVHILISEKNPQMIFQWFLNLVSHITIEAGSFGTDKSIQSL